MKFFVSIIMVFIYIFLLLLLLLVLSLFSSMNYFVIVGATAMTSKLLVVPPIPL